MIKSPTLVDFHVHGIGSRYKDNFATASFEQICAYFDNIGKQNNMNFTVAVTDHDVSTLTFEKYKELQLRYPNVKLVLGMESNCKLGAATHGVYEAAHILTYADMASDESIKQWLECQELKDISKIKAFELQYVKPSNYKMAKKFCYVLNSQFGANLNPEEFANKFSNTTYDAKTMEKELFDRVSDAFIKNLPNAFAECQTKEQISSKLANLQFKISKDKKFVLMGLLPSFHNKKNIYDNVQAALHAFNTLTKNNLEMGDIIKHINLSSSDSKEIDRNFAKQIMKYLVVNKKVCHELNLSHLEYVQRYKELEKILNSQNYETKLITSEKFFISEAKREKFGDIFYIAKSVLNKHVGLNITNHEIAEILDYSKSRNLMREEFIKFVKICLSYKNPKLYEKVKNMDLQEFENFKLGHNKYGEITLAALVPIKAGQGYITDKDDVRTPLTEIADIVKKTGAHFVLAHPDTKFKFTDDFKIPMQLFKDVNGKVVSKAKFEQIKQKCLKDGGINTNELKDKNSQILMLDLFFKICKQNGINFEGFEITKDDFKDKKALMNKLIYAAKNGLEISFGSDTHLSSLHYYNQLLKQNKITEKELNERLEFAKQINDSTADNGKFRKLYGAKFEFQSDVVSRSQKIAEPIVKNLEQVNPYQEKYLVTKTSFCDKLLGEPECEGYKPLIEFCINGNLYSFEANALKNARYDFSDPVQKPVNQQQVKNKNDCYELIK